MKTFGYLLNDENNPPKLWAIYPHPNDEGKVIFYDPQDKGNWGWTTRDEVLAFRGPFYKVALDWLHGREPLTFKR